MSSGIVVRYCGLRMIVEGSRADLLAAGVISDTERLPRAPRGCIEHIGEPWRKVTMLGDHRLRVAGAAAAAKAATLDADFRRFLALTIEEKGANK